jgi:hypothetical protein
MVVFSSFPLKKLAFVVSSMLLSLSCSNSTGQIQNPKIEGSSGNIQVSASPTPPVGYMTPCELFDENDDSHPLSIKSLKKDFKEADIVVYAEVLTMKANNYERGYRPYTYTAKVKEVFKGEFKLDETIEYGDIFEVYDKEPLESAFLGDRILWLHRWLDGGKLRYGEIEFMWGGIDCNILEKLRKISKTKH